MNEVIEIVLASAYNSKSRSFPMVAINNENGCKTATAEQTTDKHYLAY